MGVYEDLAATKDKGIGLSLANLSPKDLGTMFVDEHIPDSMIGDLYGVPKSRISYLRRKHRITIRETALGDCLQGRTERAREMNVEARTEILAKPNVSMISKAMTHFAFRNGPVEDMHANGQLSESDMKTLNKFMVNRLAYVFTLVIEERWLEFALLVETMDRMFGTDWDEAEPDDGDTREVIRLMMKSAIRRGRQ